MHGGPHFSTGTHIFLQYMDRGIQIFQNIWTGGNKKGGSKFVVTGHRSHYIIDSSDRPHPHHITDPWDTSLI